MKLKNKKAAPNIGKDQTSYLFNIVCEKVLIASLFLLTFSGLAINNTYHNLTILSLLSINIIGIYTGWLLLQEQLHIQNNFTDRICSILKKGDCSSVLSSSAAKIIGGIGWSEIGLGYFISNSLIIVLVPHLISYLALINIAGLPYSIWSIWYQKYKVKQWCLLCLLVQLLVWAIFAINLSSLANITIPQLTLSNSILIVCLYIAPLLTINTLSSKFYKVAYSESLKTEINNFRLNPEVFKALLYQQPHSDISHLTSRILWGNKNANLTVTILTNPHCYHCAKMHQRMEQLLARKKENICVQYIFHSFRKEYESSSEFLISVYLSNETSEKEKREIYDNWFKEGRMNKEAFFKKHHFNIDQKIVHLELEKHKHWKGLKDVDGTPTVFINGYQLPRQYQLDDLIYFLDLKI